MRRRVRATFLLRCVLLAACIALFAGVVFIAQGTGWVLGTLTVVACFWFVGVEGGVLPLLLEEWAERRAARSGKPVASIWFVDLDAQAERDMKDFHDDTRDNPTIR